MSDGTTTPAGDAKRTKLEKMLADLNAEEVAAVTAEIVTNNVASPDEVLKILEDFQKEYPAVNNVGKYVTAFCLACADQSCSAYVAIVGAEQSTDFSALVTIIRETCTLRQFCMYYAKWTWNVMLNNNRPPVSWAARGYREDVRFAAFDFFTGVTANAALKPPGGLKRPPTQAEVLAHNANREIAIQLSRARDIHTTNGIMALRDQQDGAGKVPQLQM